MTYHSNSPMATVLGLLLLLGGCAGGVDLAPAPQADTVPTGPGRGAEAVKGGIRIAAFVDAWSARPEDLNEEVTPIRVRITNRGDDSISLRYRDFQLTSQGRTFAAIPPYDVEGEIVKAIPTFGYPYRGFEVAPYLSPYYHDLTPFAGPFPYDAPYYGRYYPAALEIELPTQAMLELALPEGVLQPGGDVTGFLYFENVGDQVQRLIFRATPSNANTGEPIGTLTIPFVTVD